MSEGAEGSVRAQSGDRRREIDGLFAGALEQPAEGRPAWLEDRTRGDPELRAAVERLLAAAEGEQGEIPLTGGSPHGALAEDLASELDFSSPLTSRSLPAESRIGPYSIVRELGRGGMAVVYLAERVEGGFAQQVALKLLKRGIDTDEVLRRFEQERQILAALEHPAIARLYDGGVTADGRPYLVMERVDGLSIDRYCVERNLGLEGRLRLFIEVGRAIAHAHQKLVVHRDIKPSNVLVTPEGRVKLLDFGIAKLIDPTPWPAAAPTTRTHLRLLTPEYASPEQVRGEPVTTATDVYQLGLLLYELLTGRRPFVFAGRSASEVEQAICQQPPGAPSTAITHLLGDSEGETKVLPARIERRLARRLRGDLDNIVLKALAKEPDRRYVGAGAMVDDVERFLEGRPILARPASLAYRTRKFVQRHAWALGSAAAVLVTVLGVVTVYTVRLTRERNRAEREAERAERVSRFMSSVLGAADPFAAKSGRLTARALLDEGRRRVDVELADQPDLQAAMLVRLGEIYMKLGLINDARGCFERSLVLRGSLYTTESLEVAESRYLLGEALRTRDNNRARELLEAALATRRRLLAPRDPRIAEVLVELAVALMVTDQHEAATARFNEARAILEGSPFKADLAALLAAQAEHLKQFGSYDAAIELVERSLALQEEVSGTKSANVARALMKLAALQNLTRQPARALPLLSRAMTIVEQNFEPDHPLVASLLYEQARTQSDLGQLEPARANLQRAIAIQTRTSGAQNPTTLTFQYAELRILKQMGRFTEALTLSESLLRVLESIFGSTSPHLAFGLLEHSEILLRLGDRAGARKVFDRSLSLSRSDDHWELENLRTRLELAVELDHPLSSELRARYEARLAEKP